MSRLELQMNDYFPQPLDVIEWEGHKRIVLCHSQVMAKDGSAMQMFRVSGPLPFTVEEKVRVPPKLPGLAPPFEIRKVIKSVQYIDCDVWPIPDLPDYGPVLRAWRGGEVAWERNQEIADA